MPVRSEATSPNSHRRPAPARNYGRRAAALTATGTLAAGGIVLGAAPAVAADREVSSATGRFLSGVVASTNLDSIVRIAGAKAKNDGSPATVTDRDPLSVTLLNSLDLPLGGGINLLQGNGILTLGAVKQFAQAKSDGSSRGASGAVSDSGAIAVDGSSGTPANATLNLDSLLADGATSALADVDIAIGALSGVATQAKGKHGKQTGDYQIADLVVTLTSPQLAGVLGTLDNGITGGTAAGQLTDLTGLLNTLAVGGSLTGLGGLDLDSLFGGFDTTLGSGALTVDLATGKIRVNLDTLLNLNNLPPNTDIVPLLSNIVSNQVPDLIDAELDDLVDSVTAAFDGVGLVPAVPTPGVNDAAAVDALLQPLLDQITGAIGTARTSVNDTGTDSLLGGTGLLDGALDDVLDLVANVQSKLNRVFTQRALRVGLANSVSLNLASATVGPNLGPASVGLAPPRITEPDDGDTTTDRTPPISGTGKPGLSVTVKEDGRTLCKDNEVNSAGKWTCTPSRMSLGEHTITATQTDGTRTSGRSNSVTFEIVAAGGLPATGAGSTAPIAATGLGLLLGGAGLLAGNRRGGGSRGAHAKRGRHARI